MIRVVSWNIDKRVEPWHELVRMAKDGEADLALLQVSSVTPTRPDTGFWRQAI